MLLAQFSTSAAFMWEQRELECLDETETGSLKVNRSARAVGLVVARYLIFNRASLGCFPSLHTLTSSPKRRLKYWPRGSRRQTRLDTSRTESGEHLVSWRLIWPTVIICITLQTVVIVQCSGILYITISHNHSDRRSVYSTKSFMLWFCFEGCLKGCHVHLSMSLGLFLLSKKMRLDMSLFLFCSFSKIWEHYRVKMHFVLCDLSHPDANTYTILPKVLSVICDPGPQNQS